MSNMTLWNFPKMIAKVPMILKFPTLPTLKKELLPLQHLPVVSPVDLRVTKKQVFRPFCMLRFIFPLDPDGFEGCQT